MPVFCHNKYRQQRAFADADDESQTLGKKQVGVPVAEASDGMKAVSANDGVKMFEKLAGTVES